MKGRPSVVFVLPDKLGGVATIVKTILSARMADGLAYRVILTHNELDIDTRLPERLAEDQVTVVHRLPKENLYAALRRLKRALGPGPGVVVANDWLELALLSWDAGDWTTLHMLHGDIPYYYDLAVKHRSIVDGFITYSSAIDSRLRALLPGQDHLIHRLPYGIDLPPLRVGAPAGSPLRLIFVGRLEDRQKGVFLLPQIDAGLAAINIAARWTIVGAGPDGAELARRFQSAGERVRWCGARTSAEVGSLLGSHDVFVLPTRFEGLPVALLEAMGAGLVPVVSDIESGIPELVRDDITGFRVPVGDVAAFVDRIARLARDRGSLETLGRAAAALARDQYGCARRVPEYQALFARWSELRRPRRAHGVACVAYGSRLDRPYLPNNVVRMLRSARGRWKGLLGGA